MRIFLLRTVFMILAIWLLPLCAFGQTPNELAEKNYQGMVNSLMGHQYADKVPNDINFMHLRATYVSTQFYDPYSESVTLLNDLAARIKETKDEKKRTEMAKIFREAVRDQIANISVVSTAWELSKEDPIFGYHKFYNAVRGALFSTVLRSGNGNSLRDAYDVVTLDEEVFLLKYLGFKVLDTIAQRGGNYYYNIHSVVHVKTKTGREVYVNTTLPMKFLERQKKERENRKKTEPLLN